ncbi:MAG: flagellar basal body rod protein FlgC [Peptococcaceae bacterium]|nr:flagellar basal body rod protein FlgC [Candidatus Syntrophopropionicum ammoniitolerans]
MSIFSSFSISASGLTAEKLRLDLIANNIANMNTAGRLNDPANPPYCRKIPVFEQILERACAGGSPRANYRGVGVRVAQIFEDPRAPRLAYEPSDPLADDQGYVAYPNINMVNEMVNMISATRSYEANVTALNAAKDIALKALEIGR